MSVAPARGRGRARRLSVGLAIVAATPCALAQGTPAQRPAEERVLAELGGGLVALAIGTGLGAGVYSLGGDRIGAALGGASLGGTFALFALPGGISLAGSAMGGDGGYGWSFLGGFVGYLGGALLCAPLVAAVKDVGVAPYFACLGTGWLTGGVIAYEISSRNNLRAGPLRAPRARAGAPMILPALDGGAMFGVGGTF